MSLFYTNVDVIGNAVRCIGYRNGQRFNKQFKYQPTLFTRSAEPTGWKTIDGRDVAPKRFDDINHARAWLKEQKDLANSNWWGNNNYAAQFVLDAFGPDIDFDPTVVRTTSLDIEVASDEGFPNPQDANHPVITIALQCNTDKIVHVWGMVDYDPQATELEHTKPEQIRYYKCSSEIELLKHFISFISHPDNQPDVLTGWYIRMFDIPYLVNRINKLIGERSVKRLSPWFKVRERQLMIMGRTQQAYDILGIQQLDYMDLFRKFGYTFGTQESYKLDHIANVVLGERKLSYEEYGSLNLLYKENPQKFVDYNIRDVDLILRMDEELDYIMLAMIIAYRAGTNYTEAFGTVGVWDNIIYRVLDQQNIVVNPKINSHKVEYPGAYVKDPVVGRHDWVTSFDLNSLYPNLIVQYNMSPETITGAVDTHYNVDELLDGKFANKSNDIVAANGVHFKKDVAGIIPSIVREIYQQRVEVKDKMLELKQRAELGENHKTEIGKLDNKQQSIKILMNSLYGAMANAYFTYSDPRIAAAITLSGRLSIRWAEKAINAEMNRVCKTEKVDYVIAIDTDSLYVNMEEIVKRQCGGMTTQQIVDHLDTFSKNVMQPVLVNAYQRLSDHMGCVDNRMVMAREVIADRGIWTAKKRYILSVHDKEGVRYTKPKLKIMGIEAVKSSTPQACRDKMKAAFDIAIGGTEEEMQEFISEFRKEFVTLPVEEISFPRSVSDVVSKANPHTIYIKGTPIHVRGSLLYNHHLKQKGLDKKYALIQSGEKIKFVYLKTPNPIRENVISFPDFLPKELDLEPYVDYNAQYEKSFIKPLSSILDAIGWTPEKIAKLDVFFE